MFDTAAIAPVVTKDFLIDAIKTADWKYEFSDDERRQKNGQKKMHRLEQSVFNFYKRDPREAVEIWNTHAPCGSSDKTTIPEFIMRMDLFEA